MSAIEASKKQAAERAVDEHVKDGDVVGVGSGSTIVYAVARLALRVQSERLNIQCIPTSFQVIAALVSKSHPPLHIVCHISLSYTTVLMILNYSFHEEIGKYTKYNIST